MLVDDLDCKLIVEVNDYGRKLYFDYTKIRNKREILSSPKPMVLYLGTWRMVDKKGQNKKFICGINLAYLTDLSELAELQRHLPEILEPNNLKNRYWAGRELMPDLFKRAYRTYNVNNIVPTPVQGRLYALKVTDNDTKLAGEIAAKDGLEFDQLDKQIQKQYLEQAVRQRGEDDLEIKDKTKQQRVTIDKYLQDKEIEPVDIEMQPELEPDKPPEMPEKDLPKDIQKLGPGPGLGTSEEKPKASKTDVTPSALTQVKTGMPNPKQIKIDPTNPQKRTDEKK